MMGVIFGVILIIVGIIAGLGLAIFSDLDFPLIILLFALLMASGVICITTDEDFINKVPLTNNLKCKAFCVEEGYDLGHYSRDFNKCLDGSICSCRCGYNKAENYVNVEYEEPKESDEEFSVDKDYLIDKWRDDYYDCVRRYDEAILRGVCK